MLSKIAILTDLIVTLDDRPTMTPIQLKQYFDSQPNQIKLAFNALIDSLQSTNAGDSGAHNIGSDVIAGVTGTTVYAQLVSLKQAVDNAALGQIPDNSITEAKLAFNPATQTELDTLNLNNSRMITMGGMV